MSSSVRGPCDIKSFKVSTAYDVLFSRYRPSNMMLAAASALVLVFINFSWAVYQYHNITQSQTHTCCGSFRIWNNLMHFNPIWMNKLSMNLVVWTTWLFRDYRGTVSKRTIWFLGVILQRPFGLHWANNSIFCQKKTRFISIYAHNKPVLSINFQLNACFKDAMF